MSSPWFERETPFRPYLNGHTEDVTTAAKLRNLQSIRPLTDKEAWQLANAEKNICPERTIDKTHPAGPSPDRMEIIKKA